MKQISEMYNVLWDEITIMNEVPPISMQNSHLPVRTWLTSDVKVVVLSVQKCISKSISVLHQL